MSRKPLILIVIASAVLMVHGSRSMAAADVELNEQEGIFPLKNGPAAYVAVDKLLLRKEPDKQSASLGQLKEGDSLKILAITGNKETILLRGKNITAPWYYVDALSQGKGWAFGGGITLSIPAPKEHQKSISVSHAGYSVKALNGKVVVLENEDFEALGHYYFYYTFLKLNKELNSFVFFSTMHGGSGDNIPHKKVVNINSGFLATLHDNYLISPDKNHIVEAYYYEPSGMNIFKVWKVESDRLTTIYITGVDILNTGMFGSPRWVDDSNVEIPVHPLGNAPVKYTKVKYRLGGNLQFQ